ncbi:hypothetical protein BH24ACT5_BH24ACT5_15030 [soil metagenome]
MSFRYLEYNASRDVPNLVVDGSPNESTMLTLTHWPGIDQPDGLSADLSAQMAFQFAHRGDVVDADVVTNNHLDQDGLVSMFALIDPEAAFRHQELLIDVAAAGDFATYRHRQAARASMAIATYADPQRSPIAAELTGPYEAQCAALYEGLLELVLPMVLHPERFAELWAEEDSHLTGSEAALASGAITVEERGDIDLAIVDIAENEPLRAGHRFAANEYVGVHPMAIHNTTSCFRILQVHGRHYTYTDRYESWVQYRSRRPLPRVDLRPLADALTADDSGTEWRASAPSSLTAQLWTPGESSLDRAVVLHRLTEHLRCAHAAWNPYAVQT